MTPEISSINWLAALSDIKTKQAALNGLASALEAAIASGLLGQANGSDFAPLDNEAASADMGELPSGAFMKKSLRAAIRLLFSVNKRKFTTSQIAATLKEGGAESTATDFEGVVAATLNQLKANGEVLRFDDGWAFAEHYSESYRKRLADGQKKLAPNKKGRAGSKKKKKPTKKPALHAEKENSPAEERAEPPNVQQMPRAV